MRSLSLAIFAVLVSFSGFVYGTTLTYVLSCPVGNEAGVASDTFTYNLDLGVMNFEQVIQGQDAWRMNCKYSFPGHIGANYTDFKCGVDASSPAAIISVPNEVISIRGGDTSQKYDMWVTDLSEQFHPSHIYNCSLAHN